MNIKVPYLAEGLNTGTVVGFFVKEGDKVKKNQDVFELETEKAVAAIPTPEGGTVSKIHVKQGEKVSVGQVVMTVAEEGGVVARVAEPEKPKPAAEPVPPVRGTGVRGTDTPPMAATEYTYESKSGAPPPASPTVRHVARDLGIDLNRVRGTESGGRIGMADLRAYVQHLQQLAFQRAEEPPEARASKPAPAPSIDFSKWGPVEKKPLTTLRKKISERMLESWTTIPHVTQFEDADITVLNQLRAKYVAEYEKKGAHLTVTVIFLKILTEVLKKHPIFNASLDEAAGEIVFKNYIHLGIAVDTEQGLIVPVLKDADKKSILQLSTELRELAEKTRQRKVSIEDLQGSSFTISNQGGIGGAHFTPIINKPEVAILGMGRAKLRPVVFDKKIEIRMMLPLGLSYDHRVIDGANAARFITDLLAAIEGFKEEQLSPEGQQKTKKDTKK